MTDPAPKKRAPRKKAVPPAPDAVTAAEGTAPVVADEESTTPVKAPRKRATAKKAPAAAPAASSSAPPPGPSTEELERLVGGAHHDPHAVLGA
ncbi:MAG: 1,4-alpha-glucan branching enzyme, partial [Actinomycetes bacterium]